MKKKIIVIVSVVLLLLILFLPIPRGTYKDGGTKDYLALTYRIVVWNRLTYAPGGDASEGATGAYHKTSVFWFPNNFKSIDELWNMECGGNEVISNTAKSDDQTTDVENVSLCILDITPTGTKLTVRDTQITIREKCNVEKFAREERKKG